MGKVRTVDVINSEYVNLCALLGEAYHRKEEAEKFIALKEKEIDKLSLQQFQLNAEADRVKKTKTNKEDFKAVEDVLMDQPEAVVETTV